MSTPYPENPDTALRFTGIRALYGEDGFTALQQACVLIAGVGGVGSWIAEALCRSGVGKLILIDADTIEIKNTNRQLHTTQDTLGMLKVQALAERLRRINPQIEIDARAVTLTKDNIATELAACPPYAADAIDDINAKCALINFLYQRKICFATSGGAGARVDPTKLYLDDMSKAHGDGLIKHVRDILRREYHFPQGGAKMGIVCTYSTETPRYTAKTAVNLPRFGASMPVTASAGLLIASYLLNQITAAKAGKQ
ncbi:MAG: tRNA threonylcarbamoyladenosine dehydratase [Candidatus Anaerobiospirillum merdipullorum]|uniref:tRNA threonylcarbamoyladenosine dehydratase n=1 Tax=Candidatus Anaerobiospirillum merdipullorum TaxID=2838450 RepID=A0A9E2NSM5_9GAMM|nr:tRNA threonylcarbamoyladenosine dehydratase [Candidatus Anaerobiospirillum merdipullorum]